MTRAWIAMLVMMTGLAVLLPLAASKNVPTFAFDREDNPMVVPLVVNVFLVGFDGSGGSGFKLTGADLEAYLFEMYHTRRPACLENGAPLHVAFQVWYNVVPLHQSYLEDHLVPALAESLVDTGEKTVLTTDKVELAKGETDTLKQYPVYEVPVDGKVHDTFQKLYDEHTKTARYKIKNSGDASQGSEKGYAVFIVNTDKSKMTPKGAQGTDYVYRYRGEGSGSSSSFTSRDRWVVLDLSAGPSQYGHLKQGEGTVTSHTFPDPAHYQIAQSTQPEAAKLLETTFMAKVGKSIVSAIEHVFAPDIAFDELDYSEKLLVPIIVMRNHLRFDPLEAGHLYSIDIEAIKRAVHKLALPGQEVELVYGVHALGEHERIAMAVHRASRSDTVHDTRQGRFHIKPKHYLDSQVLFSSLRGASDYLASGLLGASHVSSRTFFPDTIAAGTSGTRVLPVYVFSLLDDGEPMLFDHEALYAASKEGVLVVQSNSEDVELPYFTEETPVEVSALDATTNIIAGLSEAIGGLTAPHTRFSPLHGAPVNNFMWSVGFHPFGPFSNSTKLSAMSSDHIRRNSIVSRCDAALVKIQSAMQAIGAFSDAYLTDPFGSDVAAQPPPRAKVMEWLYEHRSTQSALPLSVVGRLHDELASLQELFEQTSDVLSDADMIGALKLSDRVFRMSAAFHKYVGEELDLAERAMFCCGIQHTVVGRMNWPLILRCLIGGLFACALVLLVLGYTPADPSHLARRFGSQRYRKKAAID